jgi:peptidoglycan L-alanyl-D-glutamate endopeptidase CwlK
MAEIHPDLRRICDVALSLVGSKYTFLDFIIIDGRRTIDEQRLHVARGASKTMNSRHLHGYAVDFAAIVDGKIRWEPSYFKLIGAEFKNAAAKCRTPIKWGGDWKWKDWGHIELDRKRYPDP